MQREPSHSCRRDTCSKRPIQTCKRPLQWLSRSSACDGPIGLVANQLFLRRSLGWRQCKPRTKMDPSSRRPMWQIWLRRQRLRRYPTIVGMQRTRPWCRWVDTLPVSSFERRYCRHGMHAAIHFAKSKYRFLHGVRGSWNFLLRDEREGIEFSILFVKSFVWNLPFFGSPLKILNDFSAFCGRPLDASQVGVSGMGINMINATMHMEQLMALTRRQFVYRGVDMKVKIEFVNSTEWGGGRRTHLNEITQHVNE